MSGYGRQKLGANKTNTVRNSNRPNIIEKVRITKPELLTG
jgi:hypothetical protein